MTTRFVRSDIGERGRATSCKAFHGHTKDLGLSSENNGKPVMNFKQISDLVRCAFLHFGKVMLVEVWRIVWMTGRLEEGRPVGRQFQSS